MCGLHTRCHEFHDRFLHETRLVLSPVVFPTSFVSDLPTKRFENWLDRQVQEPLYDEFHDKLYIVSILHEENDKFGKIIGSRLNSSQKNKRDEYLENTILRNSKEWMTRPIERLWKYSVRVL